MKVFRIRPYFLAEPVSDLRQQLKRRRHDDEDDDEEAAEESKSENVSAASDSVSGDNDLEAAVVAATTDTSPGRSLLFHRPWLVHTSNNWCPRMSN